MSDQLRHEIIMPALGMTQDTGEILSWNFELGAIVQADDILFEVETDKTTVEVEAGSAGVIVEVRAAAGEAVPVGSVIAIIDSDATATPIETTVAVKDDGVGTGVEKPAEEDVISSSRAALAPTKAAAPPATASKGKALPNPAPRTVPRAALPSSAIASAAPSPGGRILASPKARLAARDKDISLEEIAASGIDQPFQYFDVHNYVPVAASSGIAQSLLQARVECAAYKEFLVWADKQTDTPDISGSVWSLFASSAWRYCCVPDRVADVHVQLEQWSSREADILSINADRVGLSGIVSNEPGGPVHILVRDMTGTPLTHYQAPDEPVCTTLTVVEDGENHLTLSLRFHESSLSLESSMSLLNRICQLVEQPLRHLL